MPENRLFDSWSNVRSAFSAQSEHYDQNDLSNPILCHMRNQVYAHVQKYLAAGDNVLELNAGTGIDALHFVKNGAKVLAIDIAPGMVNEIQRKIDRGHLQELLRVENLSYDQLQSLNGNRFNFVFSNFGGLNCAKNLTAVFQHLPPLLYPGAHFTLVIMPPLTPWEWLGVFKGNFKNAMRRLRSGGSPAHLMGYHFNTYYHTMGGITRSLGPKFELMAAESLGLFIPPPDKSYFPKKHPMIFRMLARLDKWLTPKFPFNRLGDHIILTYKFNP